MPEFSIKKILVPLDFSEITGAVIEYSCFLAELLGAELTLLHVVHVPPMAEASTWLDPVFSPGVEQDITRQMKDGAESKLKEIAADCEERSTRAGAMVKVGVPYIEISNAAEEDGFDLIVMGTQGHSGFTRFFLGSVTQRVIHRAHCNVLCIKPDEGLRDSEG